MDIFLIWAQESDGVMFLVDAWDSDSVDSNYDGWEEAVAEARKNHDDIRVVKTMIDLDAIRTAFETPTVSSSGLSVVKPS